MRKWPWVVLALAVVIGIAVVRIPARLAVSMLVPEDASLRLEEVSGSLWTGRAGRVLHEHVDLGRLDWHLDFLPLLLGRIHLDLTLSGPEVSGTARVLRRGDHLRVQDAHATLPASALDPMLDIPVLRLVGQIRIDLESLEMQGQVPRALQGSATWRDAGVTGEDQASFGTLVARFGPQTGGGFGGGISDEGGPLEVNGEFKTTLLGYEAHATLRPRDGNPQVTRALRHIGQPQTDGSVVFRVTGGLTGSSR